MGDNLQTIDLCGGDQPEGDSPKSGRTINVATDAKNTEKIPIPKHSRLNMFGEGRRCNSVSLPDSKKRKASDTSLDNSLIDPYIKRECSEAFTLNEAIERNKFLVKALEKMIEECPNTHKKIKDITKKMSVNIKDFEREVVVQWLARHKHEPIEKLTFDTETQTVPQKRNTVDMSTQTEPWHGGQQTLRSLEGIDSLEKYRQVENMAWDKTLFSKTEITVGNPLTTDNQTTKVVLVEPNDLEMNTSIQRLYREKFPELTEITNDFEIIEQITKVKSSNSTTKLSTKKVIKVTHNGTTQDIWEKLVRIRDETLEDERVAIHHVKNMTNETLQKMTEVVFRSGNTTVSIFTTADNRIVERERTTYGMIVSEGNKSYKDVLGKVKSLVGANQSAKAIRSLKSTKDGKLLLTIDKDKDALNNLHQALNEGTTGLRTRRLGMDKHIAIHVRGMEADVTVEDIKTAVTEITGTWEPENKLSELRPLGNDTLAATITVKSNQADKILEEGSIRVGLVKCRVEKRLNVRRCQRCWSYDHYSDACNGPDRSKNCFKCGQTDHSSKECKNEEACLLCSTSGHKMGTMKCPKFKFALKNARLEEKNKNSMAPTTEKTAENKIIQDEKPNNLQDSFSVQFDNLLEEARATAAAMDSTELTN